MKGFDRNEFFNDLVQRGKEMIREGEESIPLFFLVGKERIAIVGVPIENNMKEQARDALKMLIERSGCELYYSVFDAWMSSPTDEKKLLREELKKVKSPEELQEVLKLVNMTGRPATSPVRKECLVISEYSKENGTKSLMIPYERVNGGVVFEKETHDFLNTGYCRWNVWTPAQVVLEDEKKKK